MKAVMDFLVSALPWLAIGMFAAVSCVRYQNNTENTENQELMDYIVWIPVVLFLVSGVISMHSGDTSRGTVWMVLAVMNISVNASHHKKEGE